MAGTQPDPSPGEPPETVRVNTLGDSAILFDLSGSSGAYDVAMAVANRVASGRIRGILDVSAAYANVAVYFDPLMVDRRAVEQAVRRELAFVAGVPSHAAPRSPLVEISLAYDGPDISSVADRTGLSVAGVAELHQGREYRAHAIGFVPGFAFLGDLDQRLHLPRRDTPRTRVPAGSVAIAGSRTAVYPFETPGGWHLIGRTEARLFDPGREPAGLMRVGTRVRFIAT